MIPNNAPYKFLIGLLLLLLEFSYLYFVAVYPIPELNRDMVSRVTAIIGALVPVTVTKLLEYYFDRPKPVTDTEDTLLDKVLKVMQIKDKIKKEK